MPETKRGLPNILLIHGENEDKSWDLDAFGIDLGGFGVYICIHMYTSCDSVLTRDDLVHSMESSEASPMGRAVDG